MLGTDCCCRVCHAIGTDCNFGVCHVRNGNELLNCGGEVLCHVGRRTPLGTDCYCGVCYMELIAAVARATWSRLLLWGMLLGADCYCGVCYMERIATVGCATWSGLLL